MGPDMKQNKMRNYSLKRINAWPTRGVAIISAALLVSSCTWFYEPSQKELEDAITQYLDKELRQAASGNIFGQAMLTAIGADSIEVQKVEKITCTDVKRESAICEVYVEFSFGDPENSLGLLFGVGGNHSGIDRYRFVRLSSGWVVAN